MVLSAAEKKKSVKRNEDSYGGGIVRMCRYVGVWNYLEYSWQERFRDNIIFGQTLKEEVEQIMKLWRRAFQKKTAGREALSGDFAWYV